MSLNETLSYNPQRVETHLVTGSATPLQFPTGSCKLVRFEAHAANTAPFYIGSDGTHMFYQIGAAVHTDWIPINDVNLLWYSNISGALNYLSYMLLK